MNLLSLISSCLDKFYLITTKNATVTFYALFQLNPSQQGSAAIAGNSTGCWIQNWSISQIDAATGGQMKIQDLLPPPFLVIPDLFLDLKCQ
jgi:hypothetical protein